MIGLPPQSPNARGGAAGGQRRGEHISLPALDASAITQIAADVLGGDPSPDLLALAESSRGSPFLLVELLEESSVRNEAGLARAEADQMTAATA
jgi:hypothetical protein